MTVTKVYTPAGPTIAAFHASDAFVRMLRGPIGSSKSTTCAVEIIRRAQAQEPGPDGKRHSRWVAVRNTYGELRTTTVKTFTRYLCVRSRSGSLRTSHTGQHRARIYKNRQCDNCAGHVFHNSDYFSMHFLS